MALRLFDFRCECGEIYERLIDSDVKTVRHTCGKQATRLISPVRSQLDHTFPGAAMKWEKMHEREAKIDTSHKSW